MLSPAIKFHILRTFINPVLRSRLSTFVPRTHKLEPFSVFHRKTLKSIFKLSISAPTPAIHFLASELPIEGQINRDVFSLFYSVWSNPNSTIHKVVKYLLEMSCNNSRTWSIHLKHISKMYNIKDPFSCLQRKPPSKLEYKEYIPTKISAFYESELRSL